MQNYIVFFEIGDKKLKKRVKAENKTLAIIKVKESIIIHKVEQDVFRDMEDVLDIWLNSKK